MATKTELEKIIVKLTDHVSEKAAIVTKLHYKVSELELKVSQSDKERDLANKELRLQSARLKQTYQSIITIMAIRYPDETQGMFDTNYYAPNAVVPEPVNEELRLLRYLLTIVQ